VTELRKKLKKAAQWWLFTTTHGTHVLKLHGTALANVIRTTMTNTLWVTTSSQNSAVHGV